MTDKPLTPRERMSQAYADSDDPKHERRRKSIAAPYKPESREGRDMERLRTIPDAEREQHFRMFPRTRPHVCRLYQRTQRS